MLRFVGSISRRYSNAVRYIHALRAANSDQLALIYFSTAFDILGDHVIVLAHCAIFFNFQPPSVSLTCKDYLSIQLYVIWKAEYLIFHETQG